MKQFGYGVVPILITVPLSACTSGARVISPFGDHMDQDPETVPRERINHETGTGARFTLLVFTKDTHKLVRKYGGDPVSPLYGPQARRLRTEQRKAGFLAQLIRHRPDGGRMIDSDF